MPKPSAALHTATMRKPSHLHPLQWVMPAFAIAAALAAYAEHTVAYALLKPIPLLLLLACVWLVADRQRRAKPTWLLLAGLAFSMQGDVWLLLEQGFIPGLASFWLAHACYIALFRQDAPWRRNPLALLLCVGAGTGLYAYLATHGLPVSLRLPVAAYATVIALMAAQALGRASSQHSRAARTVAWGALFFMFSDTVLAINKFVQPVPAAQLWILGSYYLAQWLIVYGMLQALRRADEPANK